MSYFSIDSRFCVHWGARKMRRSAIFVNLIKTRCHMVSGSFLVLHLHAGVIRTFLSKKARKKISFDLLGSSTTTRNVSLVFPYVESSVDLFCTPISFLLLVMLWSPTSSSCCLRFPFTTEQPRIRLVKVPRLRLRRKKL